MSVCAKNTLGGSILGLKGDINNYFRCECYYCSNFEKDCEINSNLKKILKYLDSLIILFGYNDYDLSGYE